MQKRVRVSANKLANPISIIDKSRQPVIHFRMHTQTHTHTNTVADMRCGSANWRHIMCDSAHLMMGDMNHPDPAPVQVVWPLTVCTVTPGARIKSQLAIVSQTG